MRFLRHRRVLNGGKNGGYGAFNSNDDETFHVVATDLYAVSTGRR
jgi:hypothetical protein